MRAGVQVRFLAAALGLALLGSGAADGQTAAITGVVSDTSGAAVPGVRVTASNEATGLIRTASSNLLGDYVIPLLPPGVYRVTVLASGFRPLSRTGVRLRVNQTVRLDFRLTLDAVHQTVTIPEKPAMIETRSGALKSAIGSRRIRELPLNGRNPLELQYLIAGIAWTTALGQAQNRGVSINGSRPNTNNYTLDGGDNHDPYFNTPAVFPSPDALEEFTIQTSSYSASGGRNSGARMNAVTKSGTNEFHGSLFEFVRNQKLNARNFFANDVPPFKRNQFGATLGGPLQRNRTFFFAAWQTTYQRSSPASRTATVLSAAQRAGDFSALGKRLADPAGGFFPDNVIPGQRLHPAALAFLDAFVPQPNRPDNLYAFSSDERLDEHQWIARLDHHVGRAGRLTGRIVYNWRDRREATGNLPGFFAGTTYDNLNATAVSTHVFGPRMINRLTLSHIRVHRRQRSIVPGNRTWTDLGAGFTRAFHGAAPAAHDTRVAGYFDAFSRFPLTHNRSNTQLSDGLSLTRGSHLLQIGGDLRWSRLDLQELFLGDPRLRFRSRFTGDAAADLLLGLPQEAVQIAADANRPRSREYALYIQDDWKAASRLTLNLGLRWEPYLPFVDEFDRFAQIRPGWTSALYPQAPPGLVFAGDPGLPRSTLRNIWTNFGPRFGFALDPTGAGKFTVRGGYGVFYSQIRQQAHNQISTNQPFSLKLIMTEPPGGLDDPYAPGANPFPYTPPATPAEKRNYRFRTPLAITQWSPDFRNAVVQQWNVSLQRQLGANHLLTAAYVGSKGNHLFMVNELNPGLYDGSERPLDERRPMAPWFSSVRNQTSIGNSTYHSLQLTFERRFAGGLSVLANYTFSKLLDDASSDNDMPADPWNIRAEKGRSDFDMTHRFVASFVWNLPGLRWLGRPGRTAFRGWQLNGIVVAHSGRWLTVVSGLDNSGSGVNQDRADLVGDPALPPGRPRRELVRQYFNIAAFAPNPPGTFGTAGRNIVQGPGLFVINLGAIKGFPLGEQRRLEIRAEFFNLLNRVNLGNPNTNLSSTRFGYITTAGEPRVIQLAAKFVF